MRARGWSRTNSRRAVRKALNPLSDEASILYAALETRTLTTRREIGTICALVKTPQILMKISLELRCSRVPGGIIYLNICFVFEVDFIFLDFNVFKFFSITLKLKSKTWKSHHSELSGLSSETLCLEHAKLSARQIIVWADSEEDVFVFKCNSWRNTTYSPSSIKFSENFSLSDNLESSMLVFLCN